MGEFQSGSRVNDDISQGKLDLDDPEAQNQVGLFGGTTENLDDEEDLGGDQKGQLGEEEENVEDSDSADGGSDSGRGSERSGLNSETSTSSKTKRISGGSRDSDPDSSDASLTTPENSDDDSETSS